MNQQAMMPLLILVSLIAFFLSSNFGNAFVLHANEDSKLHRRKATSMNKQTMKDQMMQQQMKSEHLNPSLKSLVSKSREQVFRKPIFDGDSNYQPLTNFSNDQTNNTARQLSDTSETSNPLTDQDREGEEHSEVVSNVESPHGVTRVNNNVEDAHDKQRVITNVEDAHDKQRVITNVEDAHDKQRVNRVTFSDKRDYEIQSESPAQCNSRPNEWRMPEKINLDSSGLRRSDRSAVLSRRDKVYSHSTKCLKSVKRSSE
jgi:hypothetical protein